MTYLFSWNGSKSCCLSSTTHFRLVVYRWTHLLDEDDEDISRWRFTLKPVGVYLPSATRSSRKVWSELRFEVSSALKLTCPVRPVSWCVQVLLLGVWNSQILTGSIRTVPSLAPICWAVSKLMELKQIYLIWVIRNNLNWTLIINFFDINYTRRQ